MFLIGFASKTSFGQITVSVISNSSITSSFIRGDGTSYAVMGFDLKVGAVVPTLQSIKIGVSGTGTFSGSVPFSSIKLYKSTTNSTTYTSGSVSLVTFNLNTNSNSLVFANSSGFPLTANSDNIYFIVVISATNTNINSGDFTSGFLDIKNGGGLYSDQNATNLISSTTYATGATSSPIMAGTKLYWTGNTSTAWNTASNWTTDTSNPTNGNCTNISR